MAITLERAGMKFWYAYVGMLNSARPSITIDGKRLVVSPHVYKPLENEHAFWRITSNHQGASGERRDAVGQVCFIFTGSGSLPLLTQNRGFQKRCSDESFRSSVLEPISVWLYAHLSLPVSSTHYGVELVRRLLEMARS